MKYSDYEKKIYSLAKFLRFTFVHRLAIILTAVIIVTGSGALIGTKGIVFDTYPIKNVYEYGDSVSPYTSAFLSKATFEYSIAGQENWSETFPKDIGSYIARAKSKNSFGSYYYGNYKKFEIVKKRVEVRVNQSAITYGDKFTLSYPSLPYGDRISSFTADVEGKEQSIWIVKPNKNSIRVKSTSGEDVTKCYEIVETAVPVQVYKRPLSVKSSYAYKEYDGTPLEDNNFIITSGSLVDGDVIKANSESKATEVNAPVLNKQSYVIRDGNGLDMTSHYDISKSYDNLEIIKRSVSFFSVDKEYTYNGNQQGFSSSDIYISSGSLADNHSATYITCDQGSFVKAGSYENSFDVKIMDGYTDVTSLYYDVSTSYGSTLINPRSITVKPKSSTETYNGKEIYNNKFDIIEGSLATKDRLEVTNYPKFINVGEYSNSFTYTVYDKYTNEDYSSSYVILEEPGSIKINKKSITLELNKINVTYDGRTHNNDINVVAGSLASGDHIEVSSITKAYHAGTYSVTELEYDILNANNDSVKNNYDITFNTSSLSNCLTINKRPISITMLDREKVYDDKTFAEMGEMATYAYQVTSGNLATTDSISVKYLNDYKEYREEYYDVESEIIIYNNYINPSHTPVDVTSDYDISLINGKFKINQRPITIQTVDCQYQYDREGKIPNNVQTYSVTNLVNGHKVTGVVTKCSEINVGTYAYNADFTAVKILDSHNVDVTKNYAITFVNNGKVTIQKREATVYMSNATKVYDGTPLTSDAYTEDNLLSGDYLEFEGLPSVTHAPEHPLGEIVQNVPTSYKVFMYDHSEVTSNYNITIVPGTLKINQRPIVLRSESKSKVFDGLPIGVTNVYIFSGSLAPGDTISYEDIKSESAKHVSDSGKNTFTAVIKNADDLDVTLDYKITYVYGDLKITPCPITLSLLQDDVEYDGQDHAFNSAATYVDNDSYPTYISNGALPDTYSLKVSWEAKSEMVDAGTYYYPDSFTPTLEFSSSRDSDIEEEDFAVSYQDCERRIAKRSIVISSLNGTKEYDGLPFPNNPEITIGSLAPGHYIEYDEVELISSICEDEENPIGTPHIFDALGNEVTYNYNISYKYGKVTIYEKN